MKYREYNFEADCHRDPAERVTIKVRARDRLEAMKKGRKELEKIYADVRPRLPVQEA